MNRLSAALETQYDIHPQYATLKSHAEERITMRPLPERLM
jgi:hypothetical protein